MLHTRRRGPLTFTTTYPSTSVHTLKARAPHFSIADCGTGDVTTIGVRVGACSTHETAWPPSTLTATYSNTHVHTDPHSTRVAPQHCLSVVWTA